MFDFKIDRERDARAQTVHFKYGKREQQSTRFIL